METGMGTQVEGMTGRRDRTSYLCMEINWDAVSVVVSLYGETPGSVVVSI
jgi:hypothetical protein